MLCVKNAVQQTGGVTGRARSAAVGGALAGAGQGHRRLLRQVQYSIILCNQCIIHYIIYTI